MLEIFVSHVMWPLDDWADIRKYENSMIQDKKAMLDIPFRMLFV